MTLEALGNIGAFIGGIGVVATVAYLATQIRQNTNAIRGASELESARMRAEWHNLAAADGSLTDIWEKGNADPSSLDPTEAQRFLWFVASHFLIFEGLWNQHRRTLMDPAGWVGLERTIRGALENPLVLEWWRSGNLQLDPGFREYVDGLLRRRRDDMWSFVSTEKMREESGTQKSSTAG